MELMAAGVDGAGGPAPGTTRDSGTRARVQLGVFFMLLSLGLALGLVLAARDPRKIWAMHTEWWWAGWALGMCLPGMVFWVVPWGLRAGLDIAPGGAVEDATRAFYALLAGALLLATADLGMTWAVHALQLRGPWGMAMGYGVAPLILAALLVRPGGLRLRVGVALVPFLLYVNILMIEWATGAAGASPLR
ncbi:MAG: hypothetical protein HUU15_01925 [Candidatus Brocadiae bacterium]|nr:hypothetical protein [Candidatus Brocadiia bacterium]